MVKMGDHKRASEDWILTASKIRRLESEGLLPSGHTPKRNSTYIDAYTKHKMLINNYLLNSSGATSLLKRDTSKDKTDKDVLQEHHKFLWKEGEEVDTWEKRVAKKYYDKLFKEYCISDLSKYKENKIAMRWRTHEEVVTGKGQFICADLKCDKEKGLKSWEVNFTYIENKEKKNALVKIRLCPRCSYKLNYHHKRKLVESSKSPDERLPLDIEIKQEKMSDLEDLPSQPSSSASKSADTGEKSNSNKEFYSNHGSIESSAMKSLETRMDEYISELLP
ncbi:protein FRA10AC1 [Brevipalpus obovatus]|uniref:protein FRA10AC1 n=1 Tax=Brevipalpus obovatus TaxID=246614 RepID=UPI003D9F711F